MSAPVQALEAFVMREIAHAPCGCDREALRVAVDARRADGTYPGQTMESVLDLLDARGWVWFSDDSVRFTSQGAAAWARLR